MHSYRGIVNRLAAYTLVVCFNQLHGFDWTGWDLRLCQPSDMHGHNHNEQDRTTAVSYSTQHDLPKHRANLTTTSVLYDAALEICDRRHSLRNRN